MALLSGLVPAMGVVLPRSNPKVVSYCKAKFDSTGVPFSVGKKEEATNIPISPALIQRLSKLSGSSVISFRTLVLPVLGDCFPYVSPPDSGTRYWEWRNENTD